MEPTARPDRIDGIDALRGIAACAIVILHSALIHPLVADPESSDLIYLALGVPLFFVISAFSLSHVYSSKLKTRYDVARFAIRRFARIAPLFYVMLIAWLVLYKVVGSSQTATFSDLVLNVTFTFGLSPANQLSLVPAGWSIGVEAIFYALFPILIRIRSVAGCLAALALTSTAAATLNYVGHLDANRYFYWTSAITNAPYFTFGLLAYRIYEMHLRLSRAQEYSLLVTVLLCGIILYLVGPRYDLPNPVPVTFTMGWGAVFSVLVLIVARLPHPFIVNRATIYSGKVSYSTYLVHPLLIFATPITRWIGDLNLTVGFKVILAGFVMCILSVFVASFLFVTIEAPAQRIGRRLSELIGKYGAFREPRSRLSNLDGHESNVTLP